MNVLLLLSSLVAAQLEAPVLLAPVQLKKIMPIGSQDWRPGVLVERGRGWCADGQFKDAAVHGGEIRLVCAEYGPEGIRRVQRLDADGKVIAQETLPYDPLEKLVWLDAGRKSPLAVARDFYRVEVEGRKLDLKNAPRGLAAVGAKDGGPLLVIAYGYGDVGLEAYKPDGKLAWSTADVTDVTDVSLIRLDGKPRLAAWHGIGRLALLDLKGKVVGRANFEGNADRLLAGEGALYALDSSAGSWRERLLIMRREKDKWVKAGAADLGPVTITAWAMSKSGPVVGTSNGWVFLLDPQGQVAASTKFRSPVRSLWPADLDKDGKEDLTVVIEGASENVVVFRPK